MMGEEREEEREMVVGSRDQNLKTVACYISQRKTCFLITECKACLLYIAMQMLSV